jgi:hypothetical protein
MFQPEKVMEQATGSPAPYVLLSIFDDALTLSSYFVMVTTMVAVCVNDPEVAVSVIVEFPRGVPAYLFPPPHPLSEAIPKPRQISDTIIQRCDHRFRRPGQKKNRAPARLNDPVAFIHEGRLAAAE